MVLRSYFLTPANEPMLTDLDKEYEAIRGLKVTKTSSPNGMPNRALKHLPQLAVSPPGPDFQCRSPHPSLSYSVEARSSDLYL